MGTDNGDATTGEDKKTQRQLGKKKGSQRHRPHLVRVDQFAISDAGPDAAYSASVTVFATLEIDEAMRIQAMRGDMVL